VTVRAADAADATALKEKVGDGSAVASAIEAAIIVAAADPTSPLFGVEVPTVTATAATIPATPSAPATPAPATPAATTAPTDSASSAVLAGALVALSGAALVLA